MIAEKRMIVEKRMIAEKSMIELLDERRRVTGLSVTAFYFMFKISKTISTFVFTEYV
jgi:hypothetical protein